MGYPQGHRTEYFGSRPCSRRCRQPAETIGKSCADSQNRPYSMLFFLLFFFVNDPILTFFVSRSSPGGAPQFVCELGQLIVWKFWSAWTLDPIPSPGRNDAQSDLAGCHFAYSVAYFTEENMLVTRKCFKYIKFVIACWSFNGHLKRAYSYIISESRQSLCNFHKCPSRSEAIAWISANNCYWRI